MDRFYAGVRAGGFEYGQEGNLFDLTGVPDDRIAVRVDTRAVAGRKWRAILRHQSQLDEHQRIPEPPRWIVLDAECFVQAYLHRAPGEPVAGDLLAGLDGAWPGAGDAVATRALERGTLERHLVERAAVLATDATGLLARTTAHRHPWPERPFPPPPDRSRPSRGPAADRGTVADTVLRYGTPRERGPRRRRRPAGGRGPTPAASPSATRSAPA